MAFQGNLSVFGLADILQLITTQQKTGVLRLSRAELKAGIGFIDGNVVAADSEPGRLEARLARRLTRSGTVPEAALQGARARCKAEGIGLSEVLVAEHLVPPPVLEALTRVEVIDFLCTLFSWADGDYSFEQEDGLEQAPLVERPIGVQNVLLEGMQRIDEWPMVRATVRSDDMVFNRVPREAGPASPGSEAGAPELDGEQALVYHLVDGRSSVRDIIDSGQFGDFTVCKALKELSDEGLIANSFSGDFSELAFPDLLHAIGTSRASGRLVLKQAHAERVVSFQQGEVIAASSTDSDEDLGVYLLRQGVVSWSELEAIGFGSDRVFALRKLVVESDRCSAEEFRDLAARRVTEILVGIFAWTDGSYTFTAGRDANARQVARSLATGDIVLRGLRQIKSWSRVRQAVGGPETRYLLSADIDQVTQSMELAPEEWGVLSGFGGSRSLAELCESSSLHDFRLCQLVWALATMGVVKREGDAARQPLDRFVAALRGLEEQAQVVDDLMVGDASPHSAPLGGDGSMGGSLTGFKLPDVLRGLYVSRSTGVLTAVSGAVTNRVFIAHGVVVGASSTAPELRLGQTLVRLGYVDEAGLERLVADCGGQPLGQYIVGVGVLTHEQLNRAVEAQILGVVKPMFNWVEGRFMFEEGIPSLASLPMSELSMADVILEGVKSMSDFRGVADFLNSVTGCLAASAEPRLRFQRLRLKSADGFLLSRIDGRTGFADILQLSPLGEDDTCRIVYGLLAAGLIELTRAQETEPYAAEIPPGALPHLSAEEIDQAVASFGGLGHYAVLGVEPNATLQEIYHAYEELARRYHPDRGRSVEDKERLEEVFARIVEAWSIVKDPEERKRYDGLCAYDRPEPAVTHAAEPERELPVSAVPPVQAPAADKPKAAASASASVAPPTRSPEEIQKEAQQLYQRGLGAIAIHDYWTAYQCLERATGLVPDKADYHLKLGEACATNPQWRQTAEAAFMRASELSPWRAEPKVALARLYKRGGRHRLAEETLREALTIEPGNPAARSELEGLSPAVKSALGGVFRKMFSGQPDKAEDKPAEADKEPAGV